MDSRAADELGGVAVLVLGRLQQEGAVFEGVVVDQPYRLG